jgi:hypothetical protein
MGANWHSDFDSRLLELRRELARGNADADTVRRRARDRFAAYCLSREAIRWVADTAQQRGTTQSAVVEALVTEARK